MGYTRKNLSSALPPSFSGQASPKAISGRTSYHQVRLAFHPYPQLIQCFCNSKGFGPPSDFHRSSSWSGIAHLASGLPSPIHRPIQTWFPYASVQCFHITLKLIRLGNSPDHSSTGTPSRCLRQRRKHSAWTACRHTVSGSISLPVRGSFHLSLAVLVRYRSKEHI